MKISSVKSLAFGVVAISMLAPAGELMAQRQPQHLFLPNVSPRAEVAQTIGVTEVRVTYHRPAVNGRQIWGGLVPYDQVWRTGANENTVISFSTDVKVGGEDLAAGSYGLHTVPSAEDWQIVFSRDTSGWGSFGYDEANDALRITVTPEPSELQERMEFAFDEAGMDSAKLVLRWDKLSVPIPIEVDTSAMTLADIQSQLKGLAQFFWQGWNQAANYSLQNDLDLEQALAWAERSIGIQKQFTNLATKAQILAKMEKGEEAEAVMAEALPMGTAGNLHNYARQLLTQGAKEKALAIFQRNVEQNPDAWFVQLGLARGYSALGRFKEAAAAMRISHEKAPDAQKTYVAGLIEQLEKGNDIN